MWEFVSGHRLFKVLALFMIGFAVGQERVYVDLDQIKPLMKRILAWGLSLGIPFGILYTWSSMQGSPWGKVAHDLLYLLSVYPMGFAYAAGFGLLFSKSEKAPGWMLLAYPGKMACTNYLSQSVIGILLFLLYRPGPKPTACWGRIDRRGV